ncbi:YqzE family protein [Bacillus massiliglaciei]|uniref:YqzE family protein n=1 Tax=Bacillus massiliglaciei TaxID=1816693 RepID=UPI000DA62E1A|nr:YqzE family protein [Bacillus massiliglaciei]
MKTNAYIQYLTEQILIFFSKGKQERKEERRERKENKPPKVSEWFGIVPFAISMMLKKNK